MISLILRIRIRYGDIKHSTGTHRHALSVENRILRMRWLAVLESGDYWLESGTRIYQWRTCCCTIGLGNVSFFN